MCQHPLFVVSSLTAAVEVTGSSTNELVDNNNQPFSYQYASEEAKPCPRVTRFLHTKVGCRNPDSVEAGSTRTCLASLCISLSKELRRIEESGYRSNRTGPLKDDLSACRYTYYFTEDSLGLRNNLVSLICSRQDPFGSNNHLGHRDS